MKTRVFYLALAVAAAAIAPSCVEEQIEPQEKPEVEIVGQVFEASHEAMTKSTLIDLVPTWVEGDKILVSGADEEAECTFVADNKFQTGDEDVRLASPYYAIYPAVSGNAVDRETGIFTAAVPSVQEIPAAQNVAPGALVAVASSETTDLPFKNAVGLVKVNIGRNDIVSVLIESTNAEQKIAGKFTMNLDPDKNAEGEAPQIVMTEGVATVELKPAEGAFAAGTYYATVLPCAIDGVKVTFTRLNGESEEAVTVQKATATTIARNSGIDLGDFFLYEIGTAQELLAWNRAAAKWTEWDVVRLTADINCADVITSDNWTPNTFTGVFDGNGKIIDNFVITKAGPAAFFGEVKKGGAVKDLTFGSGCSVTTTESAPSGSVYVTGRVYAASLVCELEGSATLTNIVNYGAVNATSAGVADKGNYIGGVCASSTSSGTLTGCVNHGPVTYTAVPAVWTCAGGVFGQVTGDKSCVSACHNYGTVLFNGENNGGKSINLAGIAGSSYNASFENSSNQGKIWSNATAAAGGGTNIGGIVGHNNSKSLASVQNCSNGSETDSAAGELLFAGSTSGPVRMGGCVAYIQEVATNVTGFKNYGTITLTGSKASYATVGGVVGYVNSYNTENTISKCSNYGDVTVGAAISGSNGGAGGILGAQIITSQKDDVTITSAKITIDNCANTGNITRNTDGSSNFHVGGIAGAYAGSNESITKGDIKNCKNSGQILNTSSGIYAGSRYSYTGGIIGFARADGTISYCTNEGSVTSGICTNNDGCVRVGGIAGEASCGEMSYCINKAAVRDISSSTGGAVGGIAGMIKTRPITMIDCDNSGAVSGQFSDATSPVGRYIAGILGYSSQTVTMTDCDNSGTVTHDENAAGSINMAGIVGYRNTTATTLTNCTSSGAITNKATTASGKIAMGAMIGFGYTNTLSGCHSTSDVVNTLNNANEYVGGMIGQVENTTGLMTKWENCSVDATVSTPNTGYAGMLVGRLTDRSTNHQNVTISNVAVKGTFGTEPLAVDTFDKKAFGGNSSDYKSSTGLYYGAYVAPAE